MNKPVKQKIIRICEAILLACLIIILVLLPVHAFLSTWVGTQIGPLLVWKSWKEILLVALVPIVVVYGFLRPDLVKIICTRSVNKLVLSYVILNVFLALTTDKVSTNATLAGLSMNLRFFAMFLLAQIVVSSGYGWVERVKNMVPRWLFLVTIFLSVFAILQVTVLPKDFLMAFGYDKNITIAPYIVVDDNPDALRAFATMRGPNTLAAYLLIPLAFAGYYVFKRKDLFLSGSALILGIIALILTGSRSAWLAALIMLIIGVSFLLPAAKVKLWAKRLALPVLLILVMFVWASVNVPALRLAVFHSSPSDPYLFEGSTENHWQAAIAGVQSIVQDPIGYGPGYAGPASYYNNGNSIIAENYFVQVGQEVGLVGLALFLAICVATVKRLLKYNVVNARLLVASFAGLTLMCMFQHTWADDPTSMTWWALAGLYMADSARVNYNKKHKT